MRRVMQVSLYRLASAAEASIASPAFSPQYALSRGLAGPAAAGGGHAFEGFNYTQIKDNLYVGSCLVGPKDLDHLQEKGVQVIMNIQAESDKETLKIDIDGVRARAAEKGVNHIFQPTPDMTPANLKKAVHLLADGAAAGGNRVGGGQGGKTIYVHCTAGVGRGPVVAAAYVAWIEGQSVAAAWDLVTSKRKCFAKRQVIDTATAELLGVPPATLDFSKEFSDLDKKAIREKIMQGTF